MRLIDGSPGESDEDGLRHLLGQGGIAQTAESHSVNQGKMAFDQRGKGILGAFLEIALEQLGIRGTNHHSTMLFPLVRENRKLFPARARGD
jgi:hypothetical protein